MREDLALDGAAANELCLWTEARAETSLQFIYLQERNDDPVVRALADVVREVWSLPADVERKSRVAA
jgi:hypothetical protein